MEAHTGEATIRERVLELSSRLGQALKQATAGSLGSEALKDICDGKRDLQNRLAQDAIERYAAGAVEEAIQHWTTIADLNSQLVNIAGILPEHPDSADAQEIAECFESAADAASIAKGWALMLTCQYQRLSSSPAEAEKSAEAARQQFERVAKNGGSYSETASILMISMEAHRLASCAHAQSLLSQDEKASFTFLEAKNKMEKARTRLIQTENSDEEMLATVVADIISFGKGSKVALFSAAIPPGRFEEAAKHLIAIIKACSELDAAPYVPWMKQLNEVDRGNYSGCLAYVNAEIAAGRQNWDQADQQLHEAEEEWNRTVEAAVALGIPQSRQLAEQTRAISIQVIGALRRRIVRERVLCATIANLEDVNDRLHEEILEMAKRPSIGSSSGDLVGGSKICDIVGGNKTGRDITKAGRDLVHGNKITGTDFSQIWQQHASEIDLAELAKELDALLPHLESSGGDEHDTEISAVAAAEKAAAQNDGPKTLKWLKTSGKWVLEAAKDIAPIVVKVLELVL